jgi:signal transduction histidine kinase
LGLLLTRFILLIVSLVVAGDADPAFPMRILPPLEQAVNTVTAILVVWAVVPYFRSQPRLTDVIAVLVLLLAGIMYAFFAQDWAANAQVGMTYNGSEQSTIWGIFQVLVLAAGGLILLLRRLPGGGLRFLTVLALGIAHAVQFWDYPEMVPSATEIPFWIRLGHLVALPLLAVLAYRHSLVQLLSSQMSNRPAPEQMAATLRLATNTIRTLSPRDTARDAVHMIAEITDAAFVGVALLLGRDGEQLDLVRSAAGGQSGEGAGPEEARVWALKLSDWPSFRMAMEQAENIELLPQGVGARQLHDFYQEIGIGAAGPLLVSGLVSEGEKLGVLLLGGAEEQEHLPQAVREVLPALSDYVARAVHNAARYQEALQQEREALPVAPVEGEVVSGRIIALEQERDRALEQIETLTSKLRQSESQLSAAQRQSRDLAATVEELNRERSGDEQIAALEKEIATLRESLIEAEEAMAMAAAAEGELSTEWVTMTISRYSGELEEAQVRIAELEEELGRRESEEVSQVVTSLAQELRTPLTSIAGYTDLLLGETMGILGTKQRDFLQRVKANVDRTGVLLDQIVQVAAAPDGKATVGNVELVPMTDVIESAVNIVISQLRKKELRLNLDLDESLPPVPLNREAMSQVLIHLLSNASQASQSQGEMTVRCHADMMSSATANGTERTERFVHLAVTDSGGGIRPEDRAHVFDPQYRADHPLIAGLGDTGAGLSVAHTLVAAHGGRLWVESEMGAGSTFSVLLPMAHHNGGQG